MFIKVITNFPGKFKDEKILFACRESLINYFIRQSGNMAILFVVVGILIGGGHLFGQIILGYTVALLGACGYIGFQLVVYRKNVFIITSRRVIRQERLGLFESHIKDLRLDQIKQCYSSKQHLIQMIFTHGDIVVFSFDDSIAITFWGIPYHAQVARYISKLIDYIKENGATDDLTSFESKKDRKKKLSRSRK